MILKAEARTTEQMTEEGAEAGGKMYCKYKHSGETCLFIVDLAVVLSELVEMWNGLSHSAQLMPLLVL